MTPAEFTRLRGYVTHWQNAKALTEGPIHYTTSGGEETALHRRNQFRVSLKERNIDQNLRYLLQEAFKAGYYAGQRDGYDEGTRDGNQFDKDALKALKEQVKKLATVLDRRDGEDYPATVAEVMGEAW